jgi:hypothetical protein
MDNSKKKDLPLIREDYPGPLVKALKRVISARKAGNKKAEDSAPLISDEPPELLNARWPQSFSGELVMDLDKLFADQDFVNYILQSNTFFHGKIGFYRYIIEKISELSGILIDEKDYIHTAKSLKTIELPTTQKQKPIVLMPITETDDAFNSLVARSFEQSRFIWLIAPPVVLHSHLLVAFNNFFLSSSTTSELEHLQSIFRLSNSTVKMLDDGTYKGIVVTDYKPLVTKAHSRTAIIMRLQNL